MKIRIRSAEQSMTIALPTRMIFSKSILKFGLRIGKKYADAMPDIPPQTVDALCDEIKRIKKRYGSWELVDVQSADGEQVNITL